MTLSHKITDFIGELQQKDEQTKKQWLISATAVSMVIVMILWGFYFPTTIKNLNENETVKNKSSFSATFSQGMKVVGNKIGLQLSKVMEEVQSYLKATNSVTIQPTNLEISNSVESITPNKFP